MDKKQPSEKTVPLISNEFAVTLPSELLPASLWVYSCGLFAEGDTISGKLTKFRRPEMVSCLLDYENDLVYAVEKLQPEICAEMRLASLGTTPLSSVREKILDWGLARLEIGGGVERGPDSVRLKPREENPAEFAKMPGGPQMAMAVDVDRVGLATGGNLLLRPSVTRQVLARTSLDAVIEKSGGSLHVTKPFVVHTVHCGREMKYTIVKTLSVSAKEYRFVYEGEEMSLVEYFRLEKQPWKQWKLELKFPEFPTLLVDKKGRVFPPELCFLHKTTYFHSSSAPNPKVELSNLFACRRALENLSLSSSLKPFATAVQTKPLTFDGKQLAEVRLQYRDMTTMVANSGSWVLTGQKLLETPSVTVTVGVMSFLQEPSSVSEAEVVKTLSEEARKYGLVLNEQISVCTRLSLEASFETVRSVALDICRKLGPTGILFVLLPRRDERIYRLAKTSELFTGCPSQVLDLESFALPDFRKPQHMHSLVLKLNGKVPTLSNSSTVRRCGSAAGVAFGDLEITRRRLMVVGLRTSGDRVFVTATIDKFHSVFVCQTARLGNLSSALKRLLDRYELMNYRERPQHVLVLSEESQDALTQLRALKAVKTVFSSNSSLVSFVVLRRPLHARFFCEKPADADRKSGHVCCGVVLTQSRGSGDWSSLFPIAGTSRPLQFSVLEGDADAEQLARFLFHLCHLGGAATRSTVWPGVLGAARKLERRWRLYVAELGEKTTEKLLEEEAFQAKLQGLAFFA